MLPYANKGQVLSITKENGSEFGPHSKISEALNCSFFFGRPHKSNDRARNEWSNGKLRQLFPKGSVVKDMPESVLKDFMHNHNTFPRKSHGWKSNLEVFLNKSKVLHFRWV
jgi:IS30 family transposase